MKKNNTKWYSKIKLLGLILLSLFTSAAFAQVKISGKVTDSKGAAIAGASVSVKGLSVGATTGADGTYQFTANLKAGKYVLEISSIGNKAITESFSTDGNGDVSINASLKSDALNMDEVVVIGSSLSSKRKQLGNTVNSVSNKQLQNTGSGNITAALQGKVPGAQITQTSGDPAGGISVRMRGTSTISGSSEPLYVIDGVIANNNTVNVTATYADAGRESAIGTNRMADINPNDIEKIDVIPGAAASAIYGSRASNGVVLITTKKGKLGQMKVDFSTSLISNKLRKRVYVSKHGKMFGVKNTTNGVPYALGLISNAPTVAQGYTGAISAPYFRPNDGVTRTFATDLVDVQRYDYQDDIFQTGVGTDNYLALSGGVEKTKYYFSGGFFKNEGIIRNTDFRRINFKTRIEQTVSKYLTVIGGITYANSVAKEKPNGNVFSSPINAMNITNNVFEINKRDASGNLFAVDGARVNPISIIDEMDLKNRVNRIIGDFQLKVKPTQNLSIDYIIGVDNTSQEGVTYIKRYPYTNQYITPVATGNRPLGYAANANVSNIQLNNDLNISYNATIKNFTSTTGAGFNHQYLNTSTLFAEGEDLVNGVSTINGANIVSPARYNKAEIQTFGGYLQQTFGYKELVFVTAAGRIDGSTVFPTNSRTFFYPRVSTAINLSDFDFWKKANIEKVISSARIRASWGIAGNLTGIGAYDRFTAFSPNPLNTSIGYNLNSTLGNDIVQPERSREFEIGTDISFFKNKLGIVFNVYDKAIIDNSLLVLRNLAPTSGGLSKYENVGNMTNKGWELAINATPISNKNFSLNVFGSLARNKNLVTQSTQVAPIGLSNALGAINTFVIQAGLPAGAFYGGYFNQDASGKIALDANGRAIPALNGTAQAVKFLGSPHPDYLLTFGTGIQYKRFTFNGLLDGALGQEVFNADRRTRQGVGFGDLAEKEIKGEIPRGYVFSVYTTEEYRVESGSYVKLRELSLSYDIPKFAKFVKNSSLTFTGRNLISWDTYDGYDPETNAGGNSSVLRGIDFGNIPNPKTFQITLRSSF